MNIVIIADVASAERHTGDEAMFEVALAELTARGADSFTLIASSTKPGYAIQGVRLVAPIGFSSLPGSAHDATREKRLERVLATATDDARIADVVAAVAGADAVVVAGGGNLSASWPHHLYERVALLEIAARHGVPAVVSGQTIGPTLTHSQSERLGNALASARFVGVRDLPSFAILSRLGVASHAALQVDDAITLDSAPVDRSLPRDYVALCAYQYDADRKWVAREVAALADELHRHSGLPVVIFPNTSPVDVGDPPDSNRTDDLLAKDAEALVADRDGVHVSKMTTATAMADGIRRSAALVSMRFHPLVFALASGVPCIAVTSDDYTEQKLAGALRHAGLGEWRVPTDALITPIVSDLFAELWSRRAEIRNHLLAIVPDWFDQHHRRWDAIWSAIAGNSDGIAPLLAGSLDDVAELRPRLASARWSNALAAIGREKLAAANQRFDAAEEAAYSVRSVLESRDREIEGWRTQADDLQRRLESYSAAERQPFSSLPTNR